MKISCQACEAKYTIADEKVRGKVVKIRCKKCGTAIVVKGTELASPPPADYDDAPTRVLDREELGASATPGAWTLNVSEGDQRVAATAELVELYRSGTIDDGTFAWREGMDDWVPIGQLQELKGLLPRVSRPAPAPSSAPSQPRAAVREGRASSTDIFGASALAERDAPMTGSSSSGSAPQMTGARNETSVLFSLDALTAGGAPSPRSTPSEEESSSIVDLKTLMAPSETVATPPAKSSVEDIMNIGSGGGIFAPTLASPDLASVPPEEALAAGSGSGSAGKSNKGLVFGAIGAALVVALGVGGFLLMGKGEEPQPTAEAAGSVASAAPVADEAPTTAKAAEEAPSSEEPEAEPEQAAEPAQAADAPEKETPKAAESEKPQAAVTPAVARPTDKKAADTAASPAKATTKTPTKSSPTSRPASPAPKAKAAADAPAGGGEAPPFDRAAALSALNKATDAARACKKPDGPTGSGRIAVTFAPSGVVTAANVEGPPFAGTAVGGCIAARFRNARVPAFSGGIVTVRKSFTIN